MHDMDAPLFARLALPAYSLSDAARYAAVPPSTVRYWFYGKGGADRGAVLRDKARGVRLSYLQLIEVAVVATFRELGVPLGVIRRARDYASESLGAQYPFAEHRFLTDGQHLMMAITEGRPAGAERLVVADRSGQLVWASLIADRLAEFEYDARTGVAVRWRVGGRLSNVVIDPRLSFGAPNVRGIRTRSIRGRYLGGETPKEIGADFRIDEADVADALAFEGIPLAA